jgi:hypothetical protein
MHDNLDNSQTSHEEAGSHNTAHLAEDIEGLAFPATKQEIIDYVKENGKCPDKGEDIELLEKLPNDSYDSPTQMMAEVPDN